MADFGAPREEVNSAQNAAPERKRDFAALSCA
jgi:hypothetical protein